MPTTDFQYFCVAYTFLVEVANLHKLFHTELLPATKTATIYYTVLYALNDKPFTIHRRQLPEQHSNFSAPSYKGFWVKYDILGEWPKNWHLLTINYVVWYRHHLGIIYEILTHFAELFKAVYATYRTKKFAKVDTKGTKKERPKKCWQWCHGTNEKTIIQIIYTQINTINKWHYFTKIIKKRGWFVFFV